MNWAALIAGIVLAFILGFAVYRPLGRKWAEGTRIDPEPPAAMPVGPLVAQIVALSLLALVIAMTETTQSLGVAIAAILAVVAQTVSVGVWAQKSSFAIAVDGGYALLAGIAMIAAHVVL